MRTVLVRVQPPQPTPLVGNMRQEYRVIQPFSAAEPISGDQKRFTPGDTIACDPSQTGTTLTIEVGGAYAIYFLVERSVFNASCRLKPGSFL